MAFKFYTNLNLIFFIMTLNLKNSMYPRSFLCEEVEIKEHTDSRKELRKNDREAI